jgi:hypothetical protein
MPFGFAVLFGEPPSAWRKFAVLTYMITFIWPLKVVISTKLHTSSTAQWPRIVSIEKTLNTTTQGLCMFFAQLL